MKAKMTIKEAKKTASDVLTWAGVDIPASYFEVEIEEPEEMKELRTSWNEERDRRIRLDIKCNRLRIILIDMKALAMSYMAIDGTPRSEEYNKTVSLVNLLASKALETLTTDSLSKSSESNFNQEPKSMRTENAKDCPTCGYDAGSIVPHQCQAKGQSKVDFSKSSLWPANELNWGGYPIKVDETLDPGTVEMRNSKGELVHKIINCDTCQDTNTPPLSPKEEKIYTKGDGLSRCSKCKKPTPHSKLFYYLCNSCWGDQNLNARQFAPKSEEKPKRYEIRLAFNHGSDSIISGDTVVLQEIPNEETIDGR